MSIAGLLVRFTATYVALLVAVVIGFSLVGVRPNSGVNVGALFGAVLAACLWFASRNRRFLTAPEKKKAVLGMWAIDLLLQLLVAVAMGLAPGAELSLPPVLLTLAFIGLLHGAGIYFIVGLAGKQYAKQAAKGIA